MRTSLICCSFVAFVLLTLFTCPFAWRVKRRMGDITKNDISDGRYIHRNVVPTVEEGECGENLRWVLEDDGVLTISGTGRMTDFDDSFVCPWYEIRDNIKKVVIEQGVTSISDNVFEGCTHLTSVSIPASVSSIGTGPFAFCSSLTVIDVSEGNDHFASVGGALFSHDLSSLIQYPGGKGSGQYTIPSDVTTIAPYAFSGCKFTSIVISENVSSIGIEAFSLMDKLTSFYVSLNNDHFVASDGALFNYNLTILVAFPCAHYGAEYTYYIPDGVRRIEDYAFYNAFHLRTVIIPSSVTYIGENAFCFSSELSKVDIPENVEYIGPSAFAGLNSLASFVVHNGNKFFRVIDGVLFDYEGKTLIQYSSGMPNTTYIIPENTSSIGDAAFFYCDALETVLFPASVKSIGVMSFCGCKGLNNITLPEYLTSVGEWAFTDCEDLVGMAFPNRVTSIANFVFTDCPSLTHVNISASVNTIGKYPFYNCPNLVAVNVESGNSQYTSEDGVLFDHDVHTLIYYPAGKKNVEYTIPSTVSTLMNFAFKGCRLSRVTIPESVSSFGLLTFAQSSLQSVFYQGSISVPSFGFRGCDTLENVCVSPDYKSLSFFGANVTSDNEKCGHFRELFDHCFKGEYFDGGFIPKERINASEWVSKTDKCSKYVCLNQSGPASWSNCNSTGDTSRVCMKNDCMEFRHSAEDEFVFDLAGFVVVIELEEGVRLSDMDMNKTLETLRIVCRIEIEPADMGWETNEDGDIIRVLFYVDNEEMATELVKGINSLKEGEGCEGGVLCRRKNMRIFVDGQELISGAQRVHGMMEVTLLVLLFFIMMAFL